MKTTYILEEAKSGTACCQTCDSLIPKDALRMATDTLEEGARHPRTVYRHLICFKVPRQLTDDDGKTINGEVFVVSHVKDKTKDRDLNDPEKRQEIIAQINHIPPRKRKRDAQQDETKEEEKEEEAKEEAKEDDPPKSLVVKYKRLSQELEANPQLDISDNDRRYVEAYDFYEEDKLSQLDSALTHNRQIKTGNKDMLLTRVIDGSIHRPLGYCPLCFRGKLQLKDKFAASVICNGYHDGTSRFPCAYSCKPALAARRQLPWNDGRLSPAQKATMNAEDTAAITRSTVKYPRDGVLSQDLQAKVNDDDNLQWDLSTPQRTMASVNPFVALCKDNGVDLPTEPTVYVLKAIGRLGRNIEATDLVKEIVEQVGFAQANQEAAQQRMAAIRTSCAVNANSTIVDVLLQLSRHSYKNQHERPGKAYEEASKVITKLTFPVTEDIARDLGDSDKNIKIPGIGPMISEVIHEYLETGSVVKLEKYRAAADK